MSHTVPLSTEELLIVSCERPRLTASSCPAAPRYSRQSVMLCVSHAAVLVVVVPLSSSSSCSTVALCRPICSTGSNNDGTAPHPLGCSQPPAHQQCPMHPAVGVHHASCASASTTLPVPHRRPSTPRHSRSRVDLAPCALCVRCCNRTHGAPRTCSRTQTSPCATISSAIPLDVIALSTAHGLPWRVSSPFSSSPTRLLVPDVLTCV